MNRPKLVFWLGNYSVRRGSPSGIGQRAIQLVKGLNDLCEIQVLCARNEAQADPAIADALTTEADRALAWSEALYCFDNVPPEVLRTYHQDEKAIIAENHTPVEHCYYHSDCKQSAVVHRDAVEIYRTQVEVADKFVVRSQAERVAVLDGLCLIGRLNCDELRREESLERLVEIIPIGVLRDEIVDVSLGQADGPIPIVWNGGLYGFHNPEFLIHATASLAKRHVVHLHFPFTAERDSPVMRSLEAAVERCGVGGSVSLGCVSEARGALQSGMAFLVCIGRRSAENELCQRLRTREIFCYRSPMIVDGHGATGELVRAKGIGVILESDIRHARQQVETLIEPRTRRLLVEAIDRFKPEVLLEEPLAKLGADLSRLLSER